MTSALAEVLEKLEPCPFCGGEASATGVVRYHESHEAWFADGTRVTTAYFCNCTKCGINNMGLIGHQTREAAITAWNTRPALLSESAAIMRALSDPSTLHAMMLRGQIAIPTWRSIVDLRGEVPNGEDRQLARIAKLQEQVAALLRDAGDGAKDSARLDWLAHHGASLRNDAAEGWFVLAPYYTGIPCVDGRIRFPTARAAIDAAMHAPGGDHSEANTLKL